MTQRSKTREQKSWLEILVVLAGTLTGVVAGIVIIYVALSIAPFKERYVSVKAEFFRQIDKRIALGTLTSVEDMETVRLGVVRGKDSEKLKSDDLQGLLAEYLNSIEVDEKSIEEQQARMRLVKGLIEKLASEKPFSILPKEEQSIAVELKESIESGDSGGALTRLEKLASSLGSKLAMFEGRAERNWKWTITSALLGAAGILITIFFFLISWRVTTSRRLVYLTGKMNEIMERNRRLEELVSSVEKGVARMGEKKAKKEDEQNNSDGK